MPQIPPSSWQPRLISPNGVVAPSLTLLGNVLNDSTDEQPLQTFLAGHPHLLACLLPPRRDAWVWDRPRFGSEPIPDFLLYTRNSTGFEWLMVELESPAVAPLKQAGLPPAKLRMAQGQVREWRIWLRDNIAYAQKKLGFLGLDAESQSVIVVGRRSGFEATHSKKWRELVYDKTRVMTNDRLLDTIVGKLQPILSRLPKQFESVVLTDKGSREAAQQRLLADVDLLAAQDDPAGLDIDEVASESLEPPQLPPPSLTLEDIDRVMNRDDLRPPQVEWRALEPGSYAFSLPGFPAPIRVTTKAATFDDHFESHDFLTPGNQTYERLVREMSDESIASATDSIAPGAESKNARGGTIRWTLDGDTPREIQSLTELLSLGDREAVRLRLTADRAVAVPGDGTP